MPLKKLTKIGIILLIAAAAVWLIAPKVGPKLRKDMTEPVYQRTRKELHAWRLKYTGAASALVGAGVVCLCVGIVASKRDGA